MKKNRDSKSGFFTPRSILAFVLCSVSAGLAALAFAASTPPNTNKSASVNAGDWQSKVDSRVLAGLAAGQTEFIIYMAQQADLSGAAALATKEEKGTYVYQVLTSVAEATQPPVRTLLTQHGVTYKAFWISNAIYGKGDLTVVQAVASRPEVGAIQPVGKGAMKFPSEAPPSPSSPNVIEAVEPGLAKVNADDVWALGYKGQGAVVAGADTGVRFTHNALRNQYRGWGGSAGASNHDYNWKDAIHIPNWPPEPANACNPGGPAGAGQPSPVPCDDDQLLGGGHGSHTMGTIAGDDGGANQIGMAPQAKWIACRNMSNGVGIVPTYMECMEWFLAPTKIDGTNPDPTKSPHVINNSWGCIEACPPEPNPLRDTLEASRAAGIFYAVSAGNDGPECNTIFHPLARYPEAFTVGSTTHTTDTISSFSSRGPTAVDPENPAEPLYLKPNITAPGSTIRSSLRANDSTYGNLSGTSMAGPHVAGLVALIISANPKLAGEVDKIEDIIEESAVKKTTTEGCGVPPDSNTAVPNNTYGHGRIDALAAVNLALEEATPVPLVGVVSRKTHANPNTNFDINLPLTDPVGIECRAGQPANGNHKIVFIFANPVSNVGGAAVTSGTGSVSSSGIGTNPREYIVNLSGVSNKQRIRVTLTAITDNAGNSSPTLGVPIDILLADTNADRRVNVGDTNQTRSRSGQLTNNTNKRSDVNLDGRINVGDTNQVRSQSGQNLP
jgi:subtilisin family serine protease